MPSFVLCYSRRCYTVGGQSQPSKVAMPMGPYDFLALVFLVTICIVATKA